MLSSESTETHRYTYAGGKLLRETILTFTASGIITNEILDFRYDNAGLPYALIYQEGSAATQTYYYITNLQGDVMYMVDAVGNQVAEYEYDPYGKIIRVVDATANASSSNGEDETEDVQPYANIPTEPEDTTKTLAELNPLRYRGYYYDTETSFYYLQSRYYDPAICRFINCDGFTTTGQGLLGYNMFSYCGNNPIVYADSKGSVRIAVIYDATLTKHNGWGTDGLGMLFFGNGSWPFFTMEGHSFTTDDEFVECWNSLQGEYDEIYIYAHGSASSASIWFQTEDNYLGNTDNDKRNYSYDVLNPVKVNKLVTLCVCNAAREHGGVSTAQVFADLTSCEVKATQGKVKTSFFFGIGVPERGYSWERIQPNTGNSYNDNTSNNDGSRCGGGTRFNMRY